MSISIEAHDRICQDLHQQMRSLIVENERLKAAAQQALEALESLFNWQVDHERGKRCDDAVVALRAALAEPVQEPEALKDPAEYDDFAAAIRHNERITTWRYDSVGTVALETVYETIIYWDEGGGKRSRRELARRIVDLYAAPPQRKPLTREEAIALWADKSDGPSNGEIVSFARAIERAHGIGGQP